MAKNEFSGSYKRNHYFNGECLNKLYTYPLINCYQQILFKTIANAFY